MRKNLFCLKISAVLFVLALMSQWGRAEIVTSIDSKAALLAFAASVNGGEDYGNVNVYLAADVDLNNESWTPIGTPSHPFKGHFEGWGHKVSNLTVSGGVTDYVGLFGYVDGGSIRDVAVVSGAVSGGSYVGGICGYVANSGEISSCYSEASVSGSQYVGGICGYFAGYEISDCYSTGDVEASHSVSAYVGGLVGQVYLGDVRYCYFSGSIDYRPGVQYYGSLVGDVKNSNASTIDVENCAYKTDDANPDYTPFAIGCNKDESPADGYNKRYHAIQMQAAESWAGILNTVTYNAAWKIADGSYPQLSSFLKNEPITFNFTSEKKWLTIVPNGNYAVPAGMKAYIVTGVDLASGTVSLRNVSTLNEGRAALVWSDGGESITVSSTQGALSDYSADQWLKGSHVSPVVLKGDKTEYVLSGGIFQRAKSGTLARGKAYLKVGASVSGSSSLKVIIEDDDPTGIISQESMVNGQWSMFNGQSIYDLSGRKVSGQPAKGQVYIKNGKKIIVR
jgi:hypothetical protein